MLEKLQFRRMSRSSPGHFPTDGSPTSRSSRQLFYNVSGFLPGCTKCSVSGGKVFKLLLAEEKITETHVEKLLSWRHTGFSVYRGEKVDPEDKQGREHLASYILHPPMSQEKMACDPETGTVHDRPGGPRAKRPRATAAQLPPAPSAQPHFDILVVFGGQEFWNHIIGG
ncbi:MAG: hypothetical protein HY652_02580 [Acidobacteria bacterium]|nr:hypothetical protein [Acidobacteriota bacterium]